MYISHTVALISHATKVISLSKSSTVHELWNGYVQAGFRKGRGTRDQIANILWIIEKARELQKNTYLCFIEFAKAFDCVDHNKLWKTYRDWNTRPSYLPSEKSVCRSRSNRKNWTGKNSLVPNQERSMSRLYIVTLITYMQSTSWEMPNWMKHKLESRFPEKISITSDMHMTPPWWQKVKRN